jgi:cyclopropane fatty-acyl-phospholipid synthase-like methyltransferase
VTDASKRARLRDLVRRGYDTISAAYRTDDGLANAASAETTAPYLDWVAELAALLVPTARVLDLGCGAGVPASKALVEQGFRVTGVDISAVQISRARQLVPGAYFEQADMVTWDAPEGAFDAVVSLYALIHVPLRDQRVLLPRLRRWLVKGGYLLAIVGSGEWRGVAPYMGAEMFWEHADTDTYLQWLSQCGLDPIWHRFIPEGDAGHTLVLAKAT